MGNLSGLFGSSQDAYSIMLDPFFFLFWVTGKKQFCILFSQPAPASFRVNIAMKGPKLTPGHTGYRGYQGTTLNLFQDINAGLKEINILEIKVI